MVNIHPRDHWGWTPLDYVKREEHPKIAKLFKSADIYDQDENGQTPLHTAISYTFYNSSLAVVSLLIEEGANVNMRNKDGRTPLHKASIDGHLEIVKLLFKKGANIHIKDNNGNTALHLVNKKEHPKIAKFLDFNR